MSLSLIGKLLGWTGLPQWALELIVVGAIAGGIWYWHHEAIEQGIADQRAADALATQALEKDTAKQTAALQARATTAEQAYDKERSDHQNYIDSHPPLPVRLCIANHSGALVPPSGTLKPGATDTSAGTAGVQSVPGGDSSGGAGTAGPDISAMLSALGTAADTVSATLREFQQR